MRLAATALVSSVIILVLEVTMLLTGSSSVPIRAISHRPASQHEELAHISFKPQLMVPDDVRTDEIRQTDQQHRLNLTKKIEMLKAGLVFLESIPGYSANVTKREDVRGELLDEQIVFIKCCQKPFSVYLRWETGDKGREVIYVDGANDGKLIAHDGGWKARIPAFQLDPDCSLALKDTRYPATCAGIRYLIEQMLKVHESDLTDSTYSTCEVETDVIFDGRSCIKFTTNYESQLKSPTYRRVVTVIDSDWNLPLLTEHYGWDEGGSSVTGEDAEEATLIERYAFHDFEIQREFADDDFDRSNEKYSFR